jgi:transposase
MIIHETSMEARNRNLSQFLKRRFAGCGITVIYKSVFKGFTLHDKLVAEGYQCVVTPAHTVTQAKVSRVKTDQALAVRLRALVLNDTPYQNAVIG